MKSVDLKECRGYLQSPAPRVLTNQRPATAQFGCQNKSQNVGYQRFCTFFRTLKR